MTDNYNDPVREDRRHNFHDTRPGSKPMRHQVRSPPTKLYLYPLKESHTEEQLNDIFSKFGEVTEVYIDAKKHRWAFVSMKTQEAAKKALHELNSHAQHDFEIKFANEKQEKPPESASVAPNRTGSPADGTYGDGVPQTGSQFIDKFKGKSLAKRKAPDLSQRSLPNFQFSPSLFPALDMKNAVMPSVSNSYQKPLMNGNDCLPIPNCFNCNRQTNEQCTKCHQPFCSKDCMIIGFKGHTASCITAPRHTSEMTNQFGAIPAMNGPTNQFGAMPAMNGSAFNRTFPTISQDFADTSRSYLDHSKKSAANVNSSYDAEDMDESNGRTEVKSSRDLPYSGASQTSARKFESRKPTGDESSSRVESSHTNSPQQRMKMRKPSRHPSSTYAGTEDDDARSDFSSVVGMNSNRYSRRETDGKYKHSNKENGSTQAESFHSASERVSTFNNSNEEIDSSRDGRSNREKDSSRRNQFQGSGNFSRRENESTRDHESRMSGHRAEKKHEVSWNNESPVSERVANKENESIWDNEHHAQRPKKDHDSPQKSRSGSRVRKETAASRIRSSTEKTTRENRSGNRSSAERMSDDDVPSKRRWNNKERDDQQPREFENRRNFDSSPRSPNPPSPQSECQSPRARNPEFTPLRRADIKTNAQYEVKLVQKEPYAVILTQEIDALNHMLGALQKFNLEPVHKLEKGDRCAAKRDKDIWYRCKIHEVDPLLAKFIDFKFEPERICEENVRMLPKEFSTIAPFCYCVNFLNARSYEIDELMESKFKVEFVKKEKLSWDVNLVKKSFDEESEEARNIRDGRRRSESPRRGSSSSNQDYSDLKVTLKKGVPINVLATYIEPDSQKIFVTEFAKSEKLMTMITNIDPSSLPELKELRSNTMCLALFEGCWYRARIISVDPLEVFYIDFGNTASAQKKDLRKSLDEFAHIAPLAVAVKLRGGSESSIRVYETVDIIPIEEMIAEKIWIVKLASEKDIPDKRSPVPQSSNEGPLAKEPIGAVLKVIMTTQISTTEFYVGYVDHFERLTSVEIKDADILKMEPLRTPSVGTPCLAKFDSYWSRGKIVKSNPLTVFFIDFGNEDKPESENVYPMPQKFLDIPPMAFKIQLEEARDVEQYVPFEIKKVSEKFWRIKPHSPPAIDANMDVLILAAEDSENRIFGVIPVEMNSTFLGIQQALLKRKSNLPPVENPEINLICAEYANVLSRVEVVGTNPLRLHYLDFGFEEWKDSYCNLRSIPASLAQIEPVAFTIEVKTRGVELREQQIIQIKILEMIREGYYLVEVIDLDPCCDSQSLYDSASEANTTFLDINSPSPSSERTKGTDLAIPPALPENTTMNDDLRSEIGSVNTEVLGQDFLTTHPPLPTNYHVNEIPVDTNIALTVMNKLNDARYSGMLMRKTSHHLQLMIKYLKNLKADASFRPESGDIIAALLPDTDIWSRALVLSEPTNLKSSYRVAMFDLGCVHDVKEIAPLNKYYRDLSNLSVYCEIKQFPDRRKPLKLFKPYHKCKITKTLKDGTIIGSIKAKTNQEYEVCFKPWTPTIDELGVSKMPVSNNSRVKITAYNTSNTCHVSLRDAESKRIGNMFMADVADFCESAEPMTEEPFISEIVAVDYERSFWRGQVQEKLENTYSIFLLDRGITCTLPLENLRSLPLTSDFDTYKYLKTSFAFAVPITLKDVPVTDVPSEISSYMQKLIEKESYFDVLIDEATGEVELKFLPDESYGKQINEEKTLNEYLAKSLTPMWKKHLRGCSLVFDDYLLDTRYFEDEIRFDELAVGSKESLHVSALLTSGFSVVNESGKNYLKLLEVKFFERMLEYATTVTDSYVPTEKELCIVEHDNMWHRALCLGTQPNSPVLVHLIDNGRTVYVSHKKIRKMIAEFQHYVATALICRPKDEAQFKEKKAATLVDKTIRVLILEKEAAGEYIIDCGRIFA